MPDRVRGMDENDPEPITDDLDVLETECGRHPRSDGSDAGGWTTDCCAIALGGALMVTRTG